MLNKKPNSQEDDEEAKERSINQDVDNLSAGDDANRSVDDDDDDDVFGSDKEGEENKSENNEERK